MGAMKRLLDKRYVNPRTPGGLQIRFETHGFQALNAMLEQLPVKPAMNAMKVATRHAVKPVLLRAKQLAPEETGTLIRNLKVAVRTYVNVGSGGVVAVTGPRYFRDPTTGRNPGKYHHLVERGYTHYRSGKKVRGKHYIERAHEQTEAQQLARFKEKLPKQITKEIAKLNAKLRTKFAPWPGHSR